MFQIGYAYSRLQDKMVDVCFIGNVCCEMDLRDMSRIKKDSYFWYQQVIKENGDFL